MFRRMNDRDLSAGIMHPSCALLNYTIASRHNETMTATKRRLYYSERMLVYAWFVARISTPERLLRSMRSCRKSYQIGFQIAYV